jgi:hypothetical protein
MYEKLGDNLNLGRILIIKANLQFKAGDYFGAEKSVLVCCEQLKRELTNNTFNDAYNF